ncbi:MAG: oxidoreductase [Armatimonadetes bacterium]|nr:oxidoreductase [Armatimonadota bacterium]
MEQSAPSALTQIVFLAPAAAGLLAWLLGRVRRAVAEAFALLGSAAALVAAIGIAARVLRGEILTGWGPELRVDALSALLVLLITGVGLPATLFSIRYMRHRRLLDRDGADVTDKRLPGFYGLYLLFLATMLWGCVTNNIIMLYVAVEATTIASGLLVAFYWDRRSLEAGYKYLMLLTVGITFALFASVLLYAAATPYLPGVNAMLISELRGVASLIPRSVAVFVVAFLVVGFGTKAGIAPFHPWLPDAHAEAPSPVSALLSGVMIKMAAYALARTITIFFPVYDALTVFVVFLGGFTMLLGGVMSLVQDDLKRLLAYSSVSQMGYVIMGLGFGTYLGVYGSLFHLLHHAAAKALLFLSVGAVIYATSARSMSQLGGLGKRMPITATCFFIGAFALSGLPPFSGFMSKLTIFLAGAQEGMWTAVGVGIFTSLLTLIVIIRAGQAIFWGAPKSAAISLESVREAPASLWLAMCALAGVCLLLGVYPQIAYPLLNKATLTVAGVVSH